LSRNLQEVAPLGGYAHGKLGGVENQTSWGDLRPLPGHNQILVCRAPRTILQKHLLTATFSSEPASQLKEEEADEIPKKEELHASNPA
jgi:hypothetical protein